MGYGTRSDALWRCPRLREVLEFGKSGLEVVCPSMRHYPGEQRVAHGQVAQARDAGLDPGRHDVKKNWH
jgi:hypothetical protein